MSYIQVDLVPALVIVVVGVCVLVALRVADSSSERYARTRTEKLIALAKATRQAK